MARRASSANLCASTVHRANARTREGGHRHGVLPRAAGLWRGVRPGYDASVTRSGGTEGLVPASDHQFWVTELGRAPLPPYDYSNGLICVVGPVEAVVFTGV